MEILSKVHARHLVDWARDRPEVVVLSADLTGSCEIAEFHAAYPERFFSLGIAEQNMMSFAAGLAREGYVPFIHTFAVFLYRQALNQLVASVAYSNLPVKLFGFLPGITTPGGATHQAIEDVAVVRSIPNMTVLETGDATEVESVLDVAMEAPGPVYVRMLRGEVPRLFTDPMRLGEPRVLSEGDDVALVTAGICTEEALRATAVLRERGVSIGHVHVSTHKPLGAAPILAASRRARCGVITMENHTTVGGLGSEVAEVLAEHGVGKRLHRMGLPDVFAHGASRPFLMRKYALDALALVRKVEAVTGRALNVTESDLAAVRIEAAHSLAKVEAL